MLKQFSCPNCGGNDFIDMENGKLRCKYCDGILEAEEKKSYEDVKVKGDMKEGLEFAVHNKVVIKGNMNSIKIVKSLSNPIHVSKLKIKGDMNDISIMLLDGATLKDHGDMNSVSYQSVKKWLRKK